MTGKAPTADSWQYHPTAVSPETISDDTRLRLKAAACALRLTQTEHMSIAGYDEGSIIMTEWRPRALEEGSEILFKAKVVQGARTDYYNFVLNMPDIETGTALLRGAIRTAFEDWSPSKDPIPQSILAHFDNLRHTSHP